MNLPQWLTPFNRRVVNPIQQLWAGWAPIFCILHHVGRKSGNLYRTPVNAFSTDDGVAILLPYGQTDWLRNLTAANGCQMRRYGRMVTITDPEVVTKAEAESRVKPVWRPIFAQLPFEQAVLVRQA